MPPKSKTQDLRALIDVIKSTQDLLTHFQSSLTLTTPPKTAQSAPDLPVLPVLPDLPDPLEVTKTTATLLRSHTTTLSLLLLTPPLTPSAVITKIGDVSSGVLASMVAAASSAPHPGQNDELGLVMRGELRAQVRRLLGTWGDVLALVLKLAEQREKKSGKEKDTGPTESERQEVLAATGVVWEGCDALLGTCRDGVVGLVVRKADEWRSVLVDAVEELKEWGEDVQEEDDDEDKLEGSDDEDHQFRDEDDIFGAANKLGKDNKDLKDLLESGLKKLKMVAILYQALIKRRLRSFPTTFVPWTTTNGQTCETPATHPMTKLDELLALLKSIPETVDDLASAFYDLDELETKKTLDKCTGDAKSVVALVKENWYGQADEFTAWSDKWIGALEAS